MSGDANVAILTKQQSAINSTCHENGNLNSSTCEDSSDSGNLELQWKQRIDTLVTLSNQHRRKTKNELLERSKFLMYLVSDPSSMGVPGERVHAYNKHRPMKDLPLEEPTQQLVEAVSANAHSTDLSWILPVLKSDFTMSNYSKIFSALLQVEEAYSWLTMREYDLDCVLFRREDGYFVLDVPGLAQGRPSLLPGDIALCYQAGIEAPCVFWEGVIHRVSQDSIYLKFEPTFMREYNSHMHILNVCFKTSRTIIRRLHGALKEVNRDPHKSSILFPHEIEFVKPMISVPNTINWFNSSLNDRQKQAVKYILEGRCRPSPYIVMGPPGTGKTVTIVEAMLQIFTLAPKSRILACSGSNSAADSIASKLIASKKVDKSDMVRIVAFNRWESDAVPPNIMPFAQTCSEGNECNWINHRIVVSTCTNASKFGVFSKNSRDFDFVFIDEASTVTEPESLICILMTALHRKSLVVLVGDPHQLGPVIMSPFAPFYLRTPLIERLCSLPPYERNESKNDQQHGYYDAKCITKLIECYRCCTQLIYINSKCFYHQELISNVKRDHKLEKHFSGFPIHFHGVLGKDGQMSDSPSWYNHEEAKSVAQYVLKLIKQAHIEPNQIAIITPYRKQKEVIHTLLQASFPKKIPEISTVESFQGLEKKVIILSLVRSRDNSENLSHDTRFAIGFLNSPKRFNVATSRAKSLMIVIGNPFLLNTDPYWKQLLEFCCANGAYSGCQFNTITKNCDDSQNIPDAVE